MSPLDRDILIEWAFGLDVRGEYADEIRAVIEETDSIALPDSLTSDIEESEESDKNNLYDLIDNMSVPKKIKLALVGNKTARVILLRDRSSKQIPLLVMQNPRITETEIAEIARNPNLDQQILRAVGTNLTWMKSYSIKVGLVSNPRVPVDVSMKWVKHLRDRDLRQLARSRNIPQVISKQCQKTLERKN